MLFQQSTNPSSVKDNQTTTENQQQNNTSLAKLCSDDFDDYLDRAEEYLKSSTGQIDLGM